MSRELITESCIYEAVSVVADKLRKTLSDKGKRSFQSSHEVLGVVTEEFYELVEAVKSNTSTDVKEELQDIASVCIFALACYIQETLDW